MVRSFLGKHVFLEVAEHLLAETLMRPKKESAGLPDNCDPVVAAEMFSWKYGEVVSLPSGTVKTHESDIEQKS